MFRILGPEIGANILFFIFIASNISIKCSFSTRSPSLQFICKTLPGMGALTKIQKVFAVIMFYIGIEILLSAHGIIGLIPLI